MSGGSTIGQRAATSRKAGPVDAHVGACLRRIRDRQGITRAQLGQAVGKGFKQISKYESGENRIPASVLLLAAHRLGVTVTDFFEGLDLIEEAPTDPEHLLLLELSREFPSLAQDKEVVELVTNYWRIDGAVRPTFLGTVTVCAASAEFGTGQSDRDAD